MAELSLRRRPRISVQAPGRGGVSVPRIPTPSLAGSAEAGTLARKAESDAQQARFQQAKNSVETLSQTNPVNAYQFWLNFLKNELANYPQMYPDNSADRADIEGEIIVAQNNLKKSQQNADVAKIQAQLSKGGLTDEEQLQLLNYQLTLLEPGTEDYFTVLGNIREMEQRIKEAGAGEGKKATREKISELNNQWNLVNDAFYRGEISGAERDKRIKEISRNLLKLGETFGKEDLKFLSELDRRISMRANDPNSVIDVVDENGLWESVTSGDLAKSGKGIVQILAGTDDKGNMYKANVQLSKEGTDKWYYIDPETMQKVYTLPMETGVETDIYSVFGEDIKGKYLKTMPVYDQNMNIYGSRFIDISPEKDQEGRSEIKIYAGIDPETGERRISKQRGYFDVKTGETVIEAPVGEAEAEAKKYREEQAYEAGRPSGVAGIIADVKRAIPVLNVPTAEGLRKEAETVTKAPVKPLTAKEIEIARATPPSPIIQPLSVTGRTAGGASTPVTRVAPVTGLSLAGKSTTPAPLAKALTKKVVAPAPVAKKVTTRITAPVKKVTPVVKTQPILRIGSTGYVKGYEPVKKQTFGQKVVSGISKTYQSVTKGISDFFGKWF